MPIRDRNLKTGMKLVAHYYKKTHNCEVVGDENGKLRYRLEDGREFKSLSGACSGITGKSCDGWIFWNVDNAPKTPTVESPVPLADDKPENAVTTDKQTADAIKVCSVCGSSGGSLSTGVLQLPAQASCQDNGCQTDSMKRLLVFEQDDLEAEGQVGFGDKELRLGCHLLDAHLFEKAVNGCQFSFQCFGLVVHRDNELRLKMTDDLGGMSGIDG